MIRLPKEVNKVFKKLEEKGFQVYAVGGCVRDSLLGENPIDFDLATNASLDELRELFPEARVLSEKLSVIRFDYSNPENEEEGIILDVATFRVDGEYSDFKRPDSVYFVNNIEEDLARRDFTINAMADNPSKALVDPYEGQKDLKRKLIRTVGDPRERFQEDPVRMLRAIRFAARFDFDLQSDVFEAIKEKAHLLEILSKDVRRNEFERIITGANTGKGVKLLLATDVMRHILGTEVYDSLRRPEIKRIEDYAEGVDGTFRVLERRLGVFYSCLDKKKAEEAIEFLGFNGKMAAMLDDAIHLQDTLYFVPGKVELKDFLAKYGYERFEYLHNLSKANRIIFNTYDARILGRQAMLEEIERNEEAVYIEDLAIDGHDIIDEGIATGEKVGELLLLLTEEVHRKPDKNNREDLLALARKYAKSKLAVAMRNVLKIR